MPVSHGSERSAAVLAKVMRACRSSSSTASDRWSKNWRSGCELARDSDGLMAGRPCGSCGASVELGSGGERAQLGAVDFADAHHQVVGGAAKVEQRLGLDRAHELEVR